MTSFSPRSGTSTVYWIKTADDTLWEKVKSFDQLSAQIYRIIPDYALIDKSAGLELSISYTSMDPDYISLHVYREKNGVLTYVGEGDTVHVKDLKELTYGYEILPVVINSFTEEPYTEKPSIEFTARVTKQAYNHCSIDIGHLSAEFITDTDDTLKNEEWSIGWEGEGTFEGNIFTVSWEGRPEPGGHVSSGQLTVVLDLATLNVVSFSAQKIFTYANGDQSVDRVSGGNVPFHDIASEPNAFLYCREVGEAICANMGDLEYMKTYPGTGKWEELNEIICRMESGIHITFWYWEGQ